ncbi:Methyltransferase domain-containing protein [Cladophialophora immunda]|nr:Methyltransferase domain-containing protein [Cladophialophora immunda]
MPAQGPTSADITGSSDAPASEPPTAEQRPPEDPGPGPSSHPEPSPEPDPNQPIEVDRSADLDSAYGESIHSDLTSLASSITRGVWEYGRRYHSYGRSQYAFPNDDAEAERLDMQHAMQTHLLGDRLFWAPINPNPARVLDLGTGTGIWAIEFADMFPSAVVTGTDLSPIQPEWVPPNCSFEIDDAEAEWTWDEGTFDYIHNRNFVCAIRDWPKLIRQCYQFVKPGGWVEWHEKHPYLLSDDGSLPKDSALFQWGAKFFEASIQFGTDARSPQHLKRLMEEAGFVDVQEHILKLPVGSWPKDQRLKEVGLFETVNMTEGIQGLTIMLFTRCLHWTAAEVESFLLEVRRDVKNRAIHSYYHFYVVFGRRPE